jgi:hypothetical protein
MDEFVFEQAKTDKRFKVKALNSDLALDLCLKETGWDIKQGIVYLGRAAEVEDSNFEKNRFDVHFHPSGRP